MKGKGQDIHELTCIEAYLLSEKAGHPSHMHDYFWTQAEAIVRQRAAIVDVALKASGKKTPKTAAKAKSAPTTKAAAPAAKKPAAKKTPEPQLPLVGETTKKPAASAAKGKAAPPAKKKATPANKPAGKAK